MKNKKKNTLQVNKGIDQPPPISTEAVSKFKSHKKKKLTIRNYVDGILNNDIILLSQAITLIESTLPDHQNIAQEIIKNCLPYSGKSIRIGITGVPGVGKSSFIEALGGMITSKGKRLAVLAIDPSSKRSKGSILGDKTRMEELAGNKRAFIRPSPSGGSLGGVSRKTRESILLCEAAGYDVIFIETVGVGQSEIAVHSMTDLFLLLMLPGAGDELQGIKRGIMEMADIVAINKADGNNVKKAEGAKAQYTNALHLFPPSPSGWAPIVLTCSAITNNGIDKIWDSVNNYISMTKGNNFFSEKRNNQATYWMHDSIENGIKDHFYNYASNDNKLEKYEKEVLSGKISPFIAAGKMLEEYFKNK